MCGIAGFTLLHWQPADVAELTRRMRSPLTPRRPDGETSPWSTWPGCMFGRSGFWCR